MRKNTMRALVYRGAGDAGIEDVPVPTLGKNAAFPLEIPAKYEKGRTIAFSGDDLVLMRVEAASVCGTDLHILKGWHDSAPPVILGHEFIGRVEHTGINVGNVASGDRVAVDPNIKCGMCVRCRSGRPNQCTDMTTLGIFGNGGFAQYCLVPAKQLYKIPPANQVSHERMMLAEPLSCVLHGLEKLFIQPADRVLIFGAGPIGCLFTALCSTITLRAPVVFDPEPRRHGGAVEMGGKVSHANDIEEGMFDVLIEASGNPHAVSLMVQAADIGARLLLFGQQHAGAKIQMSPTAINQKELVMMGSYASSYSFESAIRTLADMPVLAKLITHRAHLGDMPKILEGMRKKYVTKAIIYPNGGIR